TGVAHQRRDVRLRKHKRECRVRTGRSCDSNFRSERRRHLVCCRDEIGWGLELFPNGPGGKANEEAHQSSSRTEIASRRKFTSSRKTQLSCFLFRTLFILHLKYF